MRHIIKEHFNAFTGGFVSGSALLGGWVFRHGGDFLGEYIVKLIFVIVGGVASGYCTAYGKHYFENRKKKVKTDGKANNKKNAA